MPDTVLSAEFDVAARRLLRVLFRDAVPSGLDHLDPAFFDLTLLRTALLAMDLCEPDVGDEEIIAVYLDESATHLLNPNPLFDETWYRAHYPDVDAAVRAGDFVSGFSHFLSCGIHEGRWPNFTLRASVVAESAEPLTEINAETYRHLNAGVRAFLRAFPLLSDLAHYNLYGRHLNYHGRIDRRRSSLPNAIGQLVAEIDSAFYRRRYLDDQPERDPVEHYLHVGAALGHSPTAWFDEGWYRAFYADVARAIRHGDVISGFHHYVLHGRQEGRRTQYDLTFALETRIPGVTAPALLNRLSHLRARIAPPRRFVRAGVRSGPRTLWFLLPFLNADIAFGGYTAVFALVQAVKRDGFAIGILCLEEARPNVDYFFWCQGDPALKAALADATILGRSDLETMGVREGDLFLAYSIWDLGLAARLAAAAGTGPPFLLVQEYEPVFHDNGSMRTLCAELYDIEHVAIVNSRVLRDFLRRNRIGVFGDHPGRSAPGRHLVFEHHINRLPSQKAAAMAARRERVLVAYARPEAHAARNLFEIVVLALEKTCAAGVFGPEWSFLGLGALSELPLLELGGGHVMRLVPKMSREDYVACMGAVDIGVSLMSAPHPSVVPFELATTGALVVTNTYENRTAEELRAVCGNIVPCAESLAGVTAALIEAAGRVDAFEDRVRRAYRPDNPDWDEIFSPAFVAALFVPDALTLQRPPSRSRRDAIRRLVPPNRALPRAAGSQNGNRPSDATVSPAK